MSEPAKAPAAAGRAATKKELPEHFKAYKHVWVFVEQERGLVHPVSWELMGAGRKLADKLKVDLAAVVIGPTGEATRQAAAEAFCYGADLAYVVADDVLADDRNESYTKALTDVVNTYKPEILLLGATTLGRDLAGSVATTDPRFRPCRDHHRCDPAAAGADRGISRTAVAAFARPYRKLEEQAMIEEKFDAIVVGAGMAGNAAALTLAQRGLKVLQLERGEYSGSKNVQGAILYADMLEKLIPVQGIFRPSHPRGRLQRDPETFRRRLGPGR